MGQVSKPTYGGPLTPDEIAASIMQFSPANDAEALKLLRARFPDRPLTLRVAALALLTHLRAAHPSRPDL